MAPKIVDLGKVIGVMYIMKHLIYSNKGNIIYNKNRNYITFKDDIINTYSPSGIITYGNKKKFFHDIYISKNAFIDLKKNAKLTGIQFRIDQSEYPLILSGIWPNSKSKDCNTKSFKIYMQNIDENFDEIEGSKNYNEAKEKINDMQLVIDELKWKAKDWPYGKTPHNKFGPIIPFKNNSEFNYTGNNILIRIEGIETLNDEVTLGFDMINFNSDKYSKYFRDIIYNLESEPRKSNFSLALQFETK
ncbi:hypothetical protein CPAV1605_531 [seawater metagenome]|uniref:Uncharacterized protein n=1 Tax=seawater metagenome TaxID=1561972 RepID=A0A5E8CIA8_9ZZZZ